MSKEFSTFEKELQRFKNTDFKAYIIKRFKQPFENFDQTNLSLIEEKVNDLFSFMNGFYIMEENFEKILKTIVGGDDNE